MEDYMKTISEDYKNTEGVKIDVLGTGEVRLVDFSPRMCPKGRTPEYRIAQAARVSYGKDLSTAEKDAGLIRYLYRNNHTSPFEMCSVTFRLKVPKAVAFQIYRHRTAKFGHFNEFSQRYSQSDDDVTGVWNPLDFDESIRVQSKVNHQGGVVSIGKEKNEIYDLMVQANILQKKTYNIYTEMLQKGCAKEVARFWLPMSEFTIMYVQFDLNNLLKFLELREDSHAQLETRKVANAMHLIASKIFPTVFAEYKKRKDNIKFDTAEILHLMQSKEITSVSSKKELVDKLKTVLGDDITIPQVEEAMIKGASKMVIASQNTCDGYEKIKEEKCDVSEEYSTIPDILGMDFGDERDVKYFSEVINCSANLLKFLPLIIATLLTTLLYSK
jgi:thymidylate synthase (FAD)